MEFHYHGSKKDRIDICKMILEKTGLKFIPDIHYTTMNCSSFEEMNDQLVTYINNRFKFYLWKEELYSVFPLGYEALFTNNYYLKPSPCIIMTFPLILEDDSDIPTGICGIMTHTKYLLNDKGEIIPRQDSVINEYKNVISVMKKCMKRIKNTNLFIGNDMYERFKNNELKVIYNGKYTRYSDFSF